jgi:hypothetical protein
MTTIAHDAIVPKKTQRVVPERGQVSPDDVQALAEQTAQQLLGVSAAEAFAMLDRGELDGTLAGSALSSLRFLLAA